MMDSDSPRAVLGIDAAWTEGNPSGVAVAVEDCGGWRLVAAEGSYQRFLARVMHGAQAGARASGSAPSIPDLLAAAAHLCGRQIDLATVDMPLSQKPITGRRESDNAVSRAYGARYAGTHTPSSARPGKVGLVMHHGFERQGYPLLTTQITLPGLIEVYPHPALIELSGAAERLPYKIGKAGRYWPGLSPDDRRAQIRLQWAKIITLLDAEIRGVAAEFIRDLQPCRPCEMKETENKLDAVVCAWVAICALRGGAIPFGDEDSAIWIPVGRGAPVSRG